MADVESYHITGAWRHVTDDGMVDPDAEPDLVLPTGHVVFTPLSPRWAIAGAPAKAFSIATVKALISAGELRDVQGRVGVQLPGKIGTAVVRWAVEVHLEYQGKKIEYPSLQFDLTADAHLTALIQNDVPGQPAIVIDPRIEGLVQAAEATLAEMQTFAAGLGDSATEADERATDAETAATAAATSAGAASASATAAQTARTGAETARTGAQTARTGAETARSQAEGFAGTAGTHASTATTKAGEASTSATAAATSAQTASTKATQTSADALTLRQRVEAGANEIGYNVNGDPYLLPPAEVQQLQYRVDTTVGTRVFIGNTMIFGDTGKRNVSASVLADGVKGSLFLWRVGHFVNVEWNAWTDPGWTSGSIGASFPVGFRSVNGLYWPRAYDTNGLGVYTMSDGNVQFFGTSATESRYYRGFFTFATKDPWPTSLPGVPG